MDVVKIKKKKNTTIRRGKTNLTKVFFTKFKVCAIFLRLYKCVCAYMHVIKSRAYHMAPNFRFGGW